MDDAFYSALGRCLRLEASEQEKQAVLGWMGRQAIKGGVKGVGGLAKGTAGLMGLAHKGLRPLYSKPAVDEAGKVIGRKFAPGRALGTAMVGVPAVSEGMKAMKSHPAAYRARPYTPRRPHRIY